MSDADAGAPLPLRERGRDGVDVDIDGVDREIIAHLRGDGRKAFSKIAEEVGVSPPTVSDRVHRLQEHGVISITADVDPTVDTVEISTASLERLLAHAQATRGDPGAPWFDADSQAVREAVEALDSYESPLDEDQSEDDDPELVTDGGRPAADQPYFWRYRETDEFAGHIDLLFIQEPSEKFEKGCDGEVTIITWEREDDDPELVTDGGRTRELSEGDEVTSLQCEHCGAAPVATDQLRGIHGDQTDLECSTVDCDAEGRILRTNLIGEESVRGPFEPAVPDDLGEFLAASESRSRLPCRNCGEQVRRSRLENRVCPHCRFEAEAVGDGSDARRARRGQAHPIDIVAMLIALGLLAGSLLLFGYALVVPGVVA